MSRNLHQVLSFVVALALLAVAVAAGQESGRVPLTPQEKRGRLIYNSGISESGSAITAFLGEAGVEVPASTLTCAGCHGEDGRGKPEGGVVPSNITWDALTKSYGITHPSGRKHPPYTDKGLELAIRRGLDPGGNRLALAMPRYDLPEADLADLIAWMKRVGRVADPGLTESSIRIATLVPSSGPLAETGRATSQLLEAFFKEVNSSGGIYGRAVEFVTMETATSPDRSMAEIQESVVGGAVFALVGAVTPGTELNVWSILDEEQVPLVGPLTLLPRAGVSPSSQVFHLLAGVAEQCYALVAFAKKEKREALRVGVVAATGELTEHVIESTSRALSKSDLPAPAVTTYQPGRFDPTGTVATLMKSETNTVVFAGPGEDAMKLLREADRLGWHPSICIPAPFASEELFEAPARFASRIFISYPTLPGDQSSQALGEYRALSTRYNLSARHGAAQLAALAAAKVLTEGLKKAGRDLSRSKLVSSLEKLYEFETGLTPKITYGPNRRLGSSGAYIVSVDLQQRTLVQVTGWLSVDPIAQP